VGDHQRILIAVCLYCFPDRRTWRIALEFLGISLSCAGVVDFFVSMSQNVWAVVQALFISPPPSERVKCINGLTLHLRVWTSKQMAIDNSSKRSFTKVTNWQCTMSCRLMGYPHTTSIQNSSTPIRKIQSLLSAPFNAPNSKQPACELAESPCSQPVERATTEIYRPQV